MISGLFTTQLYFGCRFLQLKLFVRSKYTVAGKIKDYPSGQSFWGLFLQHHAGFIVEPSAAIAGE
jgi:hypothetical protein